jgi:tetratricopeptide (TPR) repeat protein
VHFRAGTGAKLNPAMPPLAPPDTHHFSAAIGWLGLRAPAEAVVELDRISAAQQRHADVLEIRWVALAELKRWDDALPVAQAVTEVAPERVWGWLHRAYSLRRATGGGLPAAWDALLPAQKKFPKDATVVFNLACYACQLNRLDDARQWLRRAREIGGEEKIKEMALADDDLKPLWDEIREM